MLVADFNKILDKDIRYLAIAVEKEGIYPQAKCLDKNVVHVCVCIYIYIKREIKEMEVS
jgi:hypothetical protein